jgi:hypothetical protein
MICIHCAWFCFQGLVADLAARFKGEDSRFNWADEGKLTADSGGDRTFVVKLFVQQASRVL